MPSRRHARPASPRSAISFLNGKRRYAVLTVRTYAARRDYEPRLSAQIPRTPPANLQLTALRLSLFTGWVPLQPVIESLCDDNAVIVSVLTPAETLIAARQLAAARPHVAAIAGIVRHEDLWQLCRDELTGVDVRVDGWDIRGRWFGVVVAATPRLGELRRGETIPWRVIAAQIAQLCAKAATRADRSQPWPDLVTEGFETHWSLSH